MSEGVEQEIAKQEEAEDKAFDDAFDEAIGSESDTDLDTEDELQDEDDQPDDDPINKEADEPPQEENNDLSDVGQDNTPEPTMEERLALAEQERDDWKHKFSSTNGRISAYQRQINELTQKIQNPESTKQERDDAKEELAQQTNNSNWNEFKDEFPEFAAALDERLGEIDVREKQLDERFKQLENQVQPLQQRAQEAALQSELAALEAAHPDYEEVANSDEFNEWLEKQPKPVQQLIESDAAPDAAYLLDNFKRDTGRNSDSSELQINQQINQKRLASNVAVQSKRTARRPVADDDFDSAFEAAVNGN